MPAVSHGIARQSWHVVTARALTHLPVLEKQAAVGSGILRILAIEEWNDPTGIIHVPDDGVLIDQRAAAIGADLVVHNIAEIIVPINAGTARNLHHRRIKPINRRDAKGTAGAKLCQTGRCAAGAVE